MSSELANNIDADDVTKGQLIEWYRGLAARVQQLEEENDQLRERVQTVDQNNVSQSMMNQIIAAIINDRDEVDFAADPVQNKGLIHEQFSDLEADLEMVVNAIAEVEE